MIIENQCRDKYGEFSVLKKNENDISPYYSILIGAYNAEDTISNCLESILSQDCGDFELLVVDDGSADNTFSIVASYLNKSDKIVIIRQPNIGLTKSLNRAICLARGRVVVRQDADDLSYSNRLSKLKPFFEQGEKVVYSLAHTGFSREESVIVPRSKYYLNNRIVRELLIFGNPFVHGTLAVRRDLFLDMQYDDRLKYSQDYEFLLRVLNKGVSPCVIPSTLYFFSKSEKSISAKKRYEQSIFAKNALENNGISSRFLIVTKSGYLGFFLKIVREVVTVWLAVKYRMKR